MDTPNAFSSDIAIIGMSGQFPQASSVEAFWLTIRDGVEAITHFSDQELLAAGVPPTLLHNPHYVRARGALAAIDCFDAHFFGYSPCEATLIDPQQRLFLECAWDALERAGYDTAQDPRRIGIYAGSSMSSYLLLLYAAQPHADALGGVDALLGNDKDFLATRVAYKLNLRGPAVTVQSACSTSLVAVHFACQSLLNGECDIALAGGVSIASAQTAGYLHQHGGIYSPDGHCRAFDAQAQGTVGGSGLGLVVLKRLDDALADADQIHAVIKGFAINNDGAHKVGYTAPSVAGQAEVIREALLLARLEPATIGYVEAHGTATALGDPIEVAALTEVFRSSTERVGFCALGSVKSNIGHLDAAAGVAGLIKTVLALKHAQIPPSLHFQVPNPQIDFATSPFYVSTQLAEWPRGQTPRRAAVSSFGIGGTNAHVIVEEAPALQPSEVARGWQILPLSAKTATALASASANLAAYLRQQPSVNLADVAYTLQIGRRAFAQRQVLVCRDRDDALAALELPTDRPRPAVQTVAGASLPLTLDAGLTAGLQALSHHAGATLFMALLAVLDVLLARYSGQNDIVVGTPIANRTQAATEALIGCFVNTLVLRSRLAATAPFAELLAQVRTTCLDAYAHQDLPFEQLVEALQVPRSLSSTPLFQVMFIVQNAPLPALEFGELRVHPLINPSGSAKFELTLSLGESAHGLVGEIEYNTDLFDAATIARLGRHVQTLLAAIVAAPERLVADLPLLNAAERTQFVVEWNATSCDYPSDRPVHVLFAEQAAHTPDAIALVCDKQHLSYSTLNRRANQLAHYLGRLGVGAETLVGICMARSLDLVVGVLGILKAGAAYVPLDPTYPPERLAFMIEDAQVRVLLVATKDEGRRTIWKFPKLQS